MEHDDTRADRQSANLARHLNQTYPDTVLFLAQHAADRPGATNAQLEGVTESGLRLRLEGPVGTELVTVPLPDLPGGSTDLRSRVRELLRATRVRVPDAPLTSLERQTGGGGHTPHRQQH